MKYRKSAKSIRHGVVDIENLASVFLPIYCQHGKQVGTFTAKHAREGYVIAVGCYVDGRYYRFYTWDDWLTLAFDERFKGVTWFAHNGFGWDWVSLVKCLLDSDYKVSMIRAGFSRPVCATISDRVGRKISIADSLSVLRSSLDRLAKDILGVGKQKIDRLPHAILKSDPEAFERYLREDCRLLYEVIGKAGQLIDKVSGCDVGGFGITIGSTALRSWSRWASENQIPEISTPDELANKRYRTACRGGRVELFRPGIHEQVSVYDINSSYPASMLGEFPITLHSARTDRFVPGEIGFYKVAVRESGLYRVHPRNETTWLFSPEVACLLASSESVVIEGYVWTNTHPIFKGWIERMYEWKRSGNSAERLIAKFLMNSLYGKWLQRPVGSKWVIRPTEDERERWIEDERISYSVLDIERQIYSLSEPVRVNHEHCAIAGLILSRSRARLWNAMQHCPNPIYCDTDSLHIQGKFPSELIGDDLGQWKLEYTGDAAYAGPKMYAFRDGKTVAKGIRVGGGLGFGLDFHGISTMIRECKTIPTTFRRAVTIREVLAGENPCRFKRQSRKIRQT